MRAASEARDRVWGIADGLSKQRAAVKARFRTGPRGKVLPRSDRTVRAQPQHPLGARRPDLNANRPATPRCRAVLTKRSSSWRLWRRGGDFLLFSSPLLLRR